MRSGGVQMDTDYEDFLRFEEIEKQTKNKRKNKLRNKRRIALTDII